MPSAKITQADAKQAKTAESPAKAGKNNSRPVQQWKLDEVERIRRMVKGKRVVGVFSLSGMPSSQLQEIRKKLRGKAELTVTKTLLIKKALENASELKELDAHVQKECGLIVSDEEPFKLYKIIKNNKSRTTAKPGAIAPYDIIVPAGETDMPAGPALAELKAVKIEVKLDKGKIVVSKDSLVAKKGEVISNSLSSALAKLGLKPMEIRLKIDALCEKGVLYPASVLDIDEEKLLEDLAAAHAGALSLAVAAAYLTKTVMPLLLNKAHANAFRLATNAEILNPETITLIIGKAFAQANAINALT